MRREPRRAREGDEPDRPEQERGESARHRLPCDGGSARSVKDECADEQRGGAGPREPLAPRVCRVAYVEVGKGGPDRSAGRRDREAGEAGGRPRRQHRRRRANRKMRPSRHGAPFPSAKNSHVLHWEARSARRMADAVSLPPWFWATSLMSLPGFVGFCMVASPPFFSPPAVLLKETRPTKASYQTCCPKPQWGHGGGPPVLHCHRQRGAGARRLRLGPGSRP